MTTTAYDLAAALAVTTAHLADALDDQRPEWPQTAATARALLDLLTPADMPDSPDVTAIITRAIAAPWFKIRNAYQRPGEFTHFAVEPAADCWSDPHEPPAGLRGFLAAARHDVLTLAAENRRLRAALAFATQPPHPGMTGEWACRQCGTAYFGTPPESALCPWCQARGQITAVAPAQPAGRRRFEGSIP
jgi:hypothetical protein